MNARRTMLALALLAGTGFLASAPAQAGHDRTTVVYQVGHGARNYCPPPRHRAERRDHYRSHWRHDRGHHYRQHAWERSRYRDYRHSDHGGAHYRFRIEYHN